MGQEKLQSIVVCSFLRTKLREALPVFVLLVCWRREQLSQGDGDGVLLLPDPALGVPDRESAVMSSTPGIRKPKGRIQTFRVESRLKAPHWEASTHNWGGSYYRLEQAMRAHDTTLHYTRQKPYYYVYPEVYFDPLPAELEDSPPTEEFFMFVKVKAKKFGMTEFRKLQRNPLSELASAPSRKPSFSARSNKLCAGRSRRTWANKMEAVSEVKRLSLSSADSSELSSREAAEFAAESSPVQVPIDFNVSRTFFDMDFSIDGYLEKGFSLSADDIGLGGDREDEDHVLDMQRTTNFVPSAAADAQFLPAATTGVASSIPGDITRAISPQVSSAADSELTSPVLEIPEFISHLAQLFPAAPTDLNNVSSFDMEFSIDAYPENSGFLPPAADGIGGDREDDEVAEVVPYPPQLFQVPKISMRRQLTTWSCSQPMMSSKQPAAFLMLASGWTRRPVTVGTTTLPNWPSLTTPRFSRPGSTIQRRTSYLVLRSMGTPWLCRVPTTQLSAALPLARKRGFRHPNPEFFHKNTRCLVVEEIIHKALVLWLDP